MVEKKTSKKKLSSLRRNTELYMLTVNEYYFLSLLQNAVNSSYDRGVRVYLQFFLPC